MAMPKRYAEDKKAMCKGMEEYTLMIKIEASVQVYKEFGWSEEKIVNAIMDKYQVTAEYVKAIIEHSEADKTESMPNA